jgi:hypothetical protein
MGDKKFDNPQSANLTKVLEDCQVLQICLGQIKQASSNNDGEGTSDVASRSSSSTAITTSVNILWNQIFKLMTRSFSCGRNVGGVRTFSPHPHTFLQDQFFNYFKPEEKLAGPITS